MGTTKDKTNSAFIAASLAEVKGLRFATLLAASAAEVVRLRAGWLLGR